MSHRNFEDIFEEESPVTGKAPFITGSLIKALVGALVDAAVASGHLHEKKEGFDVHKDMPKDKDTGEDLF